MRTHLYSPYLLTLALLIGAATMKPARAAEFLMERVGAPFAKLTTHTTQPAWSESFTEPKTGLEVTRLTDVKRAKNKYSNNPPGYDRKPDAPYGKGSGAGLHNGYSRYSNVSRDNQYFLAYGTTQLAALYRMADFGLQDILRDANNKKIPGEYCELRWDRSGKPDSAGWLHYFADRRLYRQNVESGKHEMLFELPYRWVHKGDGDWDNSMRYVACAMMESPDIKDPVTKKNVKREVDVVGVYDREENKLLPGMARYDLAKTSLNGVDISPDGKWMTAQIDFYKIDDLREGIVKPRRGALRGGHGGWAWKDGRSVWVWQESATDYLQYYDPETETVRQVMPIEELGYNLGFHVGSIKNPALDGWALISTYGPVSNPLANQLFMLELEPVNRAEHPAYVEKAKGDMKGANAKWSAGWTPKGERARVWRLGSTSCLVKVPGQKGKNYYAEAYASINWDGTMVMWGSNWWATDKLEIYRMTLPADWHAKLK